MRVLICASTLAAAIAIGLGAAPAQAQEIGATAPSVLAKDPEYRENSTSFGPFTLRTGGEAFAEYNSNVFATKTNRRDDFVLNIKPFAELQHTSGPFRTTLTAVMDIRRYADFTTDNAEAASARLISQWQPQRDNTFYISGEVKRVVEDRGDPEARQVLGIGPRIYRVTGAGAGYTRQGSRFLLELSGDLQNTNALDPMDSDRDFDTYSAKATVGFRPGGLVYFTGTGYYTRRNFKLPEAGTNINRDVSTIGGLLGIRFADGGLFEGSVGAGIFWLNPEDASRPNRTGFAMQGRVTYRPRTRTAINLNLFRGDVTSFRSGGSTRTETRIGLSVDQEIRHNLLGSTGVEWQEYEYVDNAFSKARRLRFSGEVEWLLNSKMSAFAGAKYGTRSSADPLQEYSRFQGGLGIRLRF